MVEPSIVIQKQLTEVHQLKKMDAQLTALNAQEESKSKAESKTK